VKLIWACVSAKESYAYMYVLFFNQVSPDFVPCLFWNQHFLHASLQQV